MSDRIHDRDRLVDLRTDCAVFGLDPEEERELARLQGGDGADAWGEAAELEQAAAVVAMLHAARQIQPLPPALRVRLEGGARAYFAVRADVARQQRPQALGVPPKIAPQPAPAPRPVASQPVAPRPDARWPLGVLAAAASVAAIVGWWPRPVETPAPQVVAAPAPAELRSKLLGEAGTLLVAAQGTDFAQGASGDVVWQPRAQSGWMRLVGLPVNDPTVEQYQLWIFDEAQKHPVDGGVFNVSASGELLVPIDAKLRVEKPTLFAITIEKPGGVVVSDRERIAWVAKPI